MLILQSLTYRHPNKDLLFENINLTIQQHDKVALIGNNGAGKSTLLQVIAGVLPATSGQVHTETLPYYIPQLFGQYNDFTIAQALRLDEKLAALHAILDGQVTEANLNALDDDWTIEERCAEALQYWGLQNLSLTLKMGTLSGGQKTKVFLAGILIHRPGLVLLDEPTNHLDTAGRQLLYDFIGATSATLVVVSHDRTLLNALQPVCELSRQGLALYGGNYEFYREQKTIERAALHQSVRNKEKELRKANKTARESAERQQKLDARGKKKQEKEGLPTISMNTLRNNAEKSTARLKEVHAEKTGTLAQELNELRSTLPATEQMKMGFDPSTLHKGKILATANDINFGYGKALLWKAPLSFQISSGERIGLKGGNGSGKTTLIRLLLGDLHPRSGRLIRADLKGVYIDQEYTLIDNGLSVYQQAQRFNGGALQEHEVKSRLNRFLFTAADWDKPCRALSGGEKMRLVLCCLTIGQQAPDLIVLDEPTNNLDLQNIEILTQAINEYRGTLIAVSHDRYFLEQVQVERVIDLERAGDSS